MVYRSSNPVLNPGAFAQGNSQERMTYEGTINKVLILFALILSSATVTWIVGVDNPGLASLMMIAGGISGFILVLVIIMSRPSNPEILMGAYALAEGMFIGGLTLFMESFYPGISIQAGMGTIGVFGLMFTLYRFRIIQPTKKFVIGVMSAMGGIMLIYIFSFFGSMIGLPVPFIHDSGPVGIGFSLIVVSISALMLIIDFGVIESGVKYGASKNMEWWGAFGLTITLIWVYVEMIRLISKLRSN
jgi:uncharacterized YccA/Bax inhibitor family protein